MDDHEPHRHTHGGGNMQDSIHIVILGNQRGPGQVDSDRVRQGQKEGVDPSSKIGCHIPVAAPLPSRFRARLEATGHCPTAPTGSKKESAALVSGPSGVQAFQPRFMNGVQSVQEANKPRVIVSKEEFGLQQVSKVHYADCRANFIQMGHPHKRMALIAAPAAVKLIHKLKRNFCNSTSEVTKHLEESCMASCISRAMP